MPKELLREIILFFHFLLFLQVVLYWERRRRRKEEERAADGPPLVQGQTSEEVRHLVASLEEQEQAERAAAELGPTFDCVVCLSDAVPLLAGHRLSCGHVYCLPCISEHVKVKIQSHDVSGEALTCPSCPEPIKVSDVHALTWRCGDDDGAICI